MIVSLVKTFFKSIMVDKKIIVLFIILKKGVDKLQSIYFLNIP